MQQRGTAACWERKRDGRDEEIAPASFFSEAMGGAHCSTNWFEGNSGLLGKADRVPDIHGDGIALLGFDESIDRACGNTVNGGGHAEACVRAGYNILSLYGDRYVLCALSRACLRGKQSLGDPSVIPR
jgi:hypothetical protein